MNPLRKRIGRDDTASRAGLQDRGVVPDSEQRAFTWLRYEFADLFDQLALAEFHLLA
jgi:hypothetical protein